MFRRVCWTGMLGLLIGLWGCSTPNPNVRVRRTAEGLLEVDGPLEGPFKTLEGLASRNFSRRDLSDRSLWRPTRFAEKGSNRIWDRKTMVFHRENSGSCSAYLYNNTTRVISALREGKWIDIGLVYNETGDVRMFEGMDW